MEMSINNLLAAFSPGRLSDAAKVWRICEENNISRGALQSYLSDLSAAPSQVSTATPGEPCFRLCPGCGAKALLYTVKTPQGKANVYGYQSHWFCWFCGWEEYSMHQVATELKKFPGGRRD